MSGDYEDLVNWCEDGHGFIVKNIPAFEKRVLPQFFKHNKFTSFIRQLNMYDFHKMRVKGVQKEFRHVYFCKGKPELLAQIKRKTPEQVEANDKKIKEAIHFADEWKIIEDQFEAKQTKDVSFISETKEDDSIRIPVETQDKTQALTMCMMLYIKALKHNQPIEESFLEKSADINDLIMKHTEDYINSIKTVLEIKSLPKDGKHASSSRGSTTVDDNDDSDSCLGKRSLNGALEDVANIQELDVEPTKITKVDMFPENNFMNNDKADNMNDIFESSMEDCTDIYKLDTFEDFHFTLNELHGNNQSYYDLF